MAAAPIDEAILRDEKAVLPIGAYQEQYGVTVSRYRPLGRTGAVKIIGPELTSDGREALQRSADVCEMRSPI